MNTSREKNGSVTRRYLSSFEKEIGETLQKTLPAPWRLEYAAVPLDVLTGTGPMNYTPDFLITNPSTGHSVAIEVKSNLSLSMPNILKLQDIQAALAKNGTDFLIVVQQASDEPRNDRLDDYGLNAVSVHGISHAAEEIEKKLAV